MRISPHRIGAVSYALWGLLHIAGGAALLQSVIAGGANAAAPLFATSVPAEAVAPVPAGVADAVFGFHAWNIVWFGIFVLVVAVALNWRNSRAGFWANLAVAGGADLGLIVALIAPGFMRLADGMPGIVLFAVAVTFTAWGRLTAPRVAPLQGLASKEPLAAA